MSAPSARLVARSVCRTRRIVPARSIAAIRAITTSTPTAERRAISWNGSRTKPSILSSEMTRILALIGSSCSTGSMRINRMSERNCPTAPKRSVDFLFLIVHAQPIAHALPAELERLVQMRPLFWRQNPVDSIFPARKNSFGLAQIERAQIGQLIINLLQNRPDLLVLIGRQFHFGAPSVGRV